MNKGEVSITSPSSPHPPKILKEKRRKIPRKDGKHPIPQEVVGAPVKRGVLHPTERIGDLPSIKRLNL